MNRWGLGIPSRLPGGKRNLEYLHARFLLMKARGVCVAHPGRAAVREKTLCQECLDTSREAARRIVRSGMCRSHPARMSAPGKTYCQECLLGRKRKRELAIQNGMCPRHPSESALEGKVVCRQCLNDAVDRIGRARQSGVCRIHPRRKAVVNTLCRECYEAALGRTSYRYRSLSSEVVFGRWFDDCARHHLTREAIAFIPSTLHRSIPHSLLKDRNMDVINKAVIEYYRNEDHVVASQIIHYLSSSSRVV